MVWLLASGLPTGQVARVTGDSVRWVQEIARRYRAGPQAIGDRRHGNPGAAPDDGIWSCRSVAAWMSQRLGRPVSEQRGWEWMRRLGFTPQRPRPRATRADPVAQEAFKKGG